ncbi:MAG: hypothetical protein R3F59_29215 [Myxococcota bacterium]
MLLLRASLLALLACNGPDDPGPTGTPPAPVWHVVPGAVVQLTEPGAGMLQSHATVAWSDAETYAVAFAAGQEPQAQAVVQTYTAEGVALSDVARLNTAASGDKPDIAWDGARWIAAWTDVGGQVVLAAVSPAGVPTSGGVLLQSDARTDAVDLALQASGGVAIWTEFGAPGMGPTDGRIAWRAFDAALAPVGPPKLADDSSRKTADAAPTPDGGWTAVWAIEYDHPTATGQVVYEVWGRQHRGDGTAWTFRADDLDTAFPSRPAVAVRDDGMFAVTWRDKLEAEGAGLGSGAYVRLFDADAVPLGPSVAVGAGGDGDRVVVDWAGDLALVVWQETDAEGVPGVVLAGVTEDGAVAVPRTWLSAPGGDRDERPSVAVRPSADGWDALVVWEALGPSGSGQGLRAARVAVSVE